MIAHTCFVLAGLLSVASARPNFPDLLPNGRASESGASGLTCLYLGHNDCIAGAPRNQFGLDFEAAGYQWTKELCEKDSDGDGVTNGEELGDPCCEWTPGGGGDPLRSSQLSHPGVAGESGAARAPKCPSTATTQPPAPAARRAPVTPAPVVTDAATTEVVTTEVVTTEAATTQALETMEKAMTTEAAVVTESSEEPETATIVATTEAPEVSMPAATIADEQSVDMRRQPAPGSKCTGEEKAKLMFVTAGYRRNRGKYVKAESRLCPAGYTGSTLCLEVPYKTRSVKFIVDGKLVKIEKFRPYCIASDGRKRVYPWSGFRKYGKMTITYKTDKESVDVPVQVGCRRFFGRRSGRRSGRGSNRRRRRRSTRSPGRGGGQHSRATSNRGMRGGSGAWDDMSPK